MCSGQDVEDKNESQRHVKELDAGFGCAAL